MEHHGADLLPDEPPPSGPPITNLTPNAASTDSSALQTLSDLTFDPLHRTSSLSDSCRICRSEGTPSEPLFHPCKCSGSIKHVHQECLMEWLSHSQKKHCELCKTPFRFTKLYDAEMPETLPWAVFIRRACVHAMMGATGVARAAFLRSPEYLDQGEEVEPLVLTIAKMIFGFSTEPTNSTIEASLLDGASFRWPQTDPSILSGWSHLSSLTPNANINRIILDIFEGQLITCVVITGFILVFLIREWVVQQQPHGFLNDANPNNEPELRNAEQILEAIRAAGEQLERENQALNEASRALDEALARGRDLQSRAAASEQVEAEFRGWPHVETLIDDATRQLEPTLDAPATGHAETDADSQIPRDDTELNGFREGVARVAQQIRAAAATPEGDNDVIRRAQEKLNSMRIDWRRQWELALAEEIRKTNVTFPTMPLEQGETSADMASEQHAMSGVARYSAANAIPGNQTQESNGVTPATLKKKFDPLPITNAGPDAKINITLSGNGKMTAIPAPKLEIESRMLDDDEAVLKLQREVDEEDAQETNSVQDARGDSSAPANHNSHRDSNAADSNPFDPDGHMPPEHRDSETFGNRVASVFREEFGLDDDEEWEDINFEPEAEPESLQGGEGENEAPVEQRQVERPAPIRQRIADWFWGDVLLPMRLPEPVREERARQQQGANPNNVRAPAADRRGQFVEPPPAPPPPAREQPDHDPEVLAAAQQAGLDPEAIEDAEDLEGIFELIGLHGPIIGLFQTSAFCMLIVGCTVLGAVIAPYLFGKLVLSLIGSPAYFLIVMPLQTAHFAAGFIVDIALVLAGYVVVVSASGMGFLARAVQSCAPSIANFNFVQAVVAFGFNTAGDATSRLQGLFSMAEATGEETLGASWAFLGFSLHSHASLKAIGSEVDAVLSTVGAVITWAVEIISSGSVFAVAKHALVSLEDVRELPFDLSSITRLVSSYTDPFFTFAKDLSRGVLSIPPPEIPLDDASLVFWNTTDRALAILTGYVALAGLAVIYVAADTPLTTSESGQETEKAIRKTLRQAGGVVKVILIISIEMLVFPLYCGMLLDLAFLPLFADASVATRWAFAARNPCTFCFVHWFVGTCYMFHFALFVGMCRKILRKGTLWFVRDPDDPTFHPVRDVLERNVATQLRKIAFSALVYGALVVACLGGVVWALVQVCEGVFPIHWVSTEPVLEFPLNLFAFNFVTPLVLRLFKPTDAMAKMYAWWLRKCARGLRLSHFLFDDRKTDEEGHFVHKTWTTRFGGATIAPTDPSNDDADAPVRFVHDGKYVLTPCSDSYRPPKRPGQAFLQVDDDDVYIVDRKGDKNEHFAKVYVPPLFRIRVSLFMVCLWLFSAATGLCTTIVPLVLGRRILAWTFPGSQDLNDIYAYSLGAYLLAGLAFVALNSKVGAAVVGKKVKSIDASIWVGRVKRFTTRFLACLYVYGFLGIVMPIILAFALQFYVILPLQTWASGVLDPSSAAAQEAVNATASTITNLTSLLTASNQTDSSPSTATESTFHILQGYALGLVYGRMALRLIFTVPATRTPALIVSRITERGFSNPDIRLATRYFVLPASLLSAAVLAGPPLLIRIGIAILQVLRHDAQLEDTAFQTKLYRYSYPLAASIVVVALAVAEVGRATSRWRARIRDEVYLVGERLHNFGERKPPIGTRSVLRTERGGRIVAPMDEG